MPDTSSQIPGDRLTSPPISGRRGVLEQYEAGSLFPLTRQGRYKVFSTAFGAPPMVIITPTRPPATGTIMPHLVGSTKAGSFQARLVMPGAAAGAGSVNCYFLAFGQR